MEILIKWSWLEVDLQDIPVVDSKKVVVLGLLQKPIAGVKHQRIV